MLKDNRTGTTSQTFEVGNVTLDASAETVASTFLVLPSGGGILARLSDLSFHHSINFPSSAIQASTTQGTPAWAGTLTAIKATISTVSASDLTFKAFKNNVEIGTVTITAGDKIATAALSVAALTTDFFGASITASSGDATGAILTFIFEIT